MCRLGGRPIQNHSDSWTPESNRPLTGSETFEIKTWVLPLSEIAIKIPKYMEIWVKSVQSSDFGMIPIF